MDYSLFTFRACIDWIELEIATDAKTTVARVRRRLGVLYAQPIDPGIGNEANRFRIRLHDPRTWDGVVEWITKANSEFSLTAPASVTGIEVAFDAYSAGATNQDMLLLTADFLTFRQGQVEDNIRFSGQYQGGALGITNRAQLEMKLAQGRVINIGNKDDAVSQRIYFKKKDGSTRNNGELLPPEQHRARIEVTLQGAALPFQYIEEARAFKFEELARYFKFRKSDAADLPGAAQVALHQKSFRGTKAVRRDKVRSVRWYDQTTVANTRLNRLAYDALRTLTKRLNPVRRGRKPQAKNAAIAA